MKNTKLNILILEDNPDDAELIVRELKKEGFDFEWKRVETEREFKEALEEKHDLILADYKLPSFDGMSAIKLQQEISPVIPLILVSGTIGEEIAVECMKAGATDYVLKDKLSRLSPVVKRALEEAEERRKLKKADESLKASNENFLQVVSNITTGVWKADIGENGTFENTYSSPVLDELLELPPGTIKNDWDKYFSYIKPEYLEQVNNAFKEAIISPGKQIDCEYEVLKNNGQTAWFHSKGRCFEKNGKLHVFGSTTDITERKLAEEALQESEAKYRRISENTPAVVYQFEMTPDGAFTFPYINDSAKTILGVNAEDIINDSSILIGKVHPDDQQMFLNGVMKSAKTFETYHEAFRYLRNEEVIWLECRTSPNLMKNGNILWDGFLVDITERKLAEEALRKSEKRLSLIYNSTSDNMILMKVENPSTYRIVSFNDEYFQTARNIYGEISREQLLNHTSEELKELFDWPDSLYDNTILNYLKVIETGKPVKTVDELPTPRTTLFFETVYYPVFDSEKICTHILYTSRDITERKQAEGELKVSEERFRKLIDNMPSGVAIYKPLKNGENFEFIDINIEAENITKSSKKELIGSTLLDKFPNMNKSPLFESLKRIHNDGQDIYIPPFFYKDEQREGWRENHIYKLNTGEIVAIFHDVTKLKEFENKLRNNNKELIKAKEKVEESENLYRTLVETSTEGIVLTDLNGKYLFCNTMQAKILGYENSAEIIGKNGFAFIAPESQEESKKTLQKLQKEKSVHGEFKIIRKDGSIFPAEYSSTMINDEKGNPVSILVMIRDITERKRTQLALQENEKKLSSFMNAATDGFTILDENLVIRYMNPAGLKMLGLKQEDVVGVSALDINPNLKKSDRHDAYLKVIETGKPFFADDFTIHPKFGNLYLSVSAFKVGEGLGVTAENITERKQAEEELKIRMNELEIFNEATVGRELKMIELKKEINELLAKTGQKPKYEIIV